MNMDVDVTRVFQNRLATSMGIDKYQHIMQQSSVTNIAEDMDFQRIFNGFYIVRRNEAWRKIYYTYFEQMKKATPTFTEIITYLYEQTGYIEPSFSSKMLATIYPNKPIWDQYVLQNLSLELTGRTKEERLKNAISLYDSIENWYKDFLQTEQAKEWICAFNRVLPDYQWMTNTKKIDFILWSIR